MSYNPRFLVTANGADITDVIKRHMVRLDIRDESGLNSDVFNLTLADHLPGRLVQLPPTGAELKVHIGYGDKLQEMGLFVVDELGLEGPPDLVVLSAKAAIFDGTPTGKKQLQSMQSRSWPDEHKLGELAGQMASEHGMKLMISPELADIQLAHIDQHSESDLNLLLRLGQMYDFTVKPANGNLILAKRGKAVTTSGAPIPEVVVKGSEITRHSWALDARSGGGTVVAEFRPERGADRQAVVIGEGLPIKRLRHPYKTEAEARAGARAEHDSQVREMVKLSITLPGRPELSAEAPMRIEGHRRPELNRQWIVVRVTHTLDDNGYVCQVEAETPLGLQQQALIAQGEQNPLKEETTELEDALMGEEPAYAGSDEG